MPTHPPGSSGAASSENEERHEAEAPQTELDTELDAMRAERDEWHERFLRTAAEFDNYRKRSEKEKLEYVARAKSAVLVEILPCLDACERALESFSEVSKVSDDLGEYRAGVELLFKQLTDTLARLGVTPMEVQGELFDPHLHEALSRLETAEYEENTVIEELRKGYLYKGRLLRPAQVIVAPPPNAGSDEPSEEPIETSPP